MKKSLIDKVLLEWSYRCDDGIPDINNPKKRKLLENLLEISLPQDSAEKLPLASADIKRDISDMLDDIDLGSEEGQKLVRSIYTRVKNLKFKNKNISDLEKIFKEKNLDSPLLVKDIYYTAYDFEEVKEFIDYIKSPSLLYNDIEDNSDFVSLANSKSGLSESFIKSLLDRNATIQGTNVGRGEIAIVLLTKDAKKNLGDEDEKGDVSISSKVVEIKASKGKDIGATMALPKRVSRYSSISKDVKNFIKSYSTKEEYSSQLENFIKLENKTGINWVTRLKEFYNISTPVNKNIKQEITSFIQKYYENLKIENFDKFFTESEGDKILIKEIAIALAKEYLLTFKNILEINVSNGKYIFVNSSNIEDLIKSNTLKISSVKDEAPRLYYNG